MQNPTQTNYLGLWPVPWDPRLQCPGARIDRYDGPRWKHQVIVSGMPGNRGDFVAGWLSFSDTSKYVSLDWMIRPVWGKSDIRPFWFWGQSNHYLEESEHDHELRAQIKDQLEVFIDEQIDDNSLQIVTKSHITSALISRVIPEKHQDRFTFVDILVNDYDSIRQVRWEGFVKNNLLVSQLIINQLDESPGAARILCEERYLNLKQELNDTVFMDSLIHESSDNRSNDNDKLRVLTLDYRDLMQENGCDQLIDYFDLPKEWARSIWNRYYPLSCVYDRIYALGRWWEKP